MGGEGGERDKERWGRQKRKRKREREREREGERGGERERMTRILDTAVVPLYISAQFANCHNPDKLDLKKDESKSTTKV